MSDSTQQQNGTHASSSTSTPPLHSADIPSTDVSSHLPTSSFPETSADTSAPTISDPVTPAAVSSPSNATQVALPKPAPTATSSTAVTSSSAAPAATSGSATPPTSSASGRVLGVPDGLKVVVHFRAAGDAPILKKSKFMLNANYRFIVLIDFLRKHLHYKPTDALVGHSGTHASLPCQRTQSCRGYRAPLTSSSLYSHLLHVAVSVLLRVVLSLARRPDLRPLLVLSTEQRAGHQLRHSGRMGITTNDRHPVRYSTLLCLHHQHLLLPYPPSLSVASCVSEAFDELLRVLG